VLRDEPVWWYGERQQIIARCLEPLGQLYGAIAVARYQDATPYRSNLPVICVGNFTAGGSGKTPLAIHIAERLKAMGERPVFLTRGYGGSSKGPVLVDPLNHGARDIGDEPLLLARAAPTMVARDREAGAQAIEALGNEASAIIMDDGLQNPSLTKDLSLVVVDAKRGIGNGRMIPAGPLRAPFAFQSGLCDAIVLNCSATAIAQTADFERTVLSTLDCPILRASIEPAEDTSWLRGTSVVAFAGIGNPQRFFDLVQWLGATVVERVVFRDHEELTDDDAQRLLAKARATNATLITTEKDWVRLQSQSVPVAELKTVSRALAIHTVLDAEDEDRLDGLLRSALSAHRAKGSAA
jgi:tetraacyldisaccharide 4'-kinase